MIFSIALSLLLLAHADDKVVTTSPTTLSLERIYSDPPLEGRPPSQARVSPAGSLITYLKPSAKDSEVLDLWAQPLPAGAPFLIVAAEDLLAGKTQRFSEQEKMMMERKRITKRGITDYQWCGNNDKALLFPFDGDLVYAALLNDGSKQAPQLRVSRLTSDERAELAPTCNPAGDKVSFVADGSLFVVDVATKKTKRLAAGGGTITMGLAEFIAEEELDRHEGHWWSADGQLLLAAVVDEREVGIKVRPQIFADRTDMVSQRYPAAGENNAAVKLLLVNARGGAATRFELPPDSEYLARAGFFDDGVPWVQVFNRSQSRLALYAREKSMWRLIAEDRDDAWVDAHNDFHELSGGRLLWSSERSGRRQLEIVDRVSGARTQITHADEKIVEVIAVDRSVGTAGMAFAHVARDRGQQQAVVAIDLDNGAIIPIVERPGWHAASADKRGTSFIVTSSNWGVPPRVAAVGRDGKQLLALDDNVATELMRALRPPEEWLTLIAADGKTPINALLMKPPSLKSGPVPMITYAYGGPTGQLVARRWQRMFPVLLHWAQQGFAVLVVDTRGMGQRDRDVARAHFHALGDMEVADLFGAVDQVSKRFSFIDNKHIGLFGWSYGGTLASRAILDDKTPFAAAVAVAPVTDWRLYDTAYTERYLGTPQQQPALYQQSSVLERTKMLQRPFLLIHGTADDNVLFENSLRLVESLQRDQKNFELMIYPGKAHGIGPRTSLRHVYSTVTAFFQRTLRP
jgi:dipeptidyl-peptidase 4